MSNWNDNWSCRELRYRELLNTGEFYYTNDPTTASKKQTYTEWENLPNKNTDMKIFKEKAGVISPNECWVCICEGYLYTADTLEDLIQVLNTEWKHDKHIVG